MSDVNYVVDREADKEVYRQTLGDAELPPEQLHYRNHTIDDASHSENGVES